MQTGSLYSGDSDLVPGIVSRTAINIGSVPISRKVPEISSWCAGR